MNEIFHTPQVKLILRDFLERYLTIMYYSITMFNNINDRPCYESLSMPKLRKP